MDIINIDKSKKAHLFIVSAPSGTGKTTICKAVCKKFPDVEFSVSYTTRKPRNGEKEAIDYYFITKDEFQKGIDQGQWAEWAKVHDNFYGTSAKFIDNKLLKGHNVLLDIDVQGTVQILKKYSESITIFIMPPSIEELKQRLEKRGTDSQDVISKRLINAEQEISQKDIYKYTIVNDDLEKAVNEFFSIIEGVVNKFY